MNRMSSRRRLLRVGAAAVGAGLAGCLGGSGDGGGEGDGEGGDEGTSSTTTTATSTTTATTTTTTPSTPGLWPMLQGDPAHTGRSPGPGIGPGAPAVRWQRSLGSPITVDPVVDASAVYAATDAGVLIALDRANGRARWRRSFPRVTGLARDGGTLYVAADRLYALRVSDGTDWWAAEVGDHPTTPPNVHEGTVYVGSPEPRLYAFTGAGEQKWRTVPLVGALTAPAVDGSGVYVADGRGFYGLRRDTGQQRWQAATSSQATGAATVANDRVYVPFAGGSLHGAAKADGTDRFTATLGGTPQASPAVDEEGVYVTGTTGKLHKLSPHDGTELWTADLGGAAYSAPALAGDFVYVGDDARLHAFARESSAQVWSWKAGGSVKAGAAISDGTVYVAGSNWRLTALA